MALRANFLDRQQCDRRRIGTTTVDFAPLHPIAEAQYQASFHARTTRLISIAQDSALIQGIAMSGASRASRWITRKILQSVHPANLCRTSVHRLSDCVNHLRQPCVAWCANRHETRLGSDRSRWYWVARRVSYDGSFPAGSHAA